MVCLKRNWRHLKWGRSQTNYSSKWKPPLKPSRQLTACRTWHTSCGNLTGSYPQTLRWARESATRRTEPGLFFTWITASSTRCSRNGVWANHGIQLSRNLQQPKTAVELTLLSGDSTKVTTISRRSWWKPTGAFPQMDSHTLVRVSRKALFKYTPRTWKRNTKCSDTCYVLWPRRERLTARSQDECFAREKMGEGHCIAFPI